MKQKLFAAVLALLLLSCAVLPGFAAEVDPDETGSITINAVYDGKKIRGGVLSIYLIATLEEDDNGDYYYKTKSDFTSVVKEFTTENITSTTIPTKLQEQLTKKGLLSKYAARDIVDAEGQVEFKNLELGVYLVVQTKAATGYQKMKPFLVTVPVYENGEYVYDVTADSKVSPPPKPTEAPPETTKPSGKLPQTGQLNWPVPVLAAAGLTLFTIGTLLRRGRKEEYEG